MLTHTHTHTHTPRVISGQDSHCTRWLKSYGSCCSALQPYVPATVCLFHECVCVCACVCAAEKNTRVAKLNHENAALQYRVQELTSQVSTHAATISFTQAHAHTHTHTHTHHTNCEPYCQPLR